MAVCEQFAGNSSFPTLDDRDLAEVFKSAAEGPLPCM